MLIGNVISLKKKQVSQTIARGGPRSQIAIPAQGMIEFRDALTDLLEEFGTDDGGFKGTFLTHFKLINVFGTSGFLI